MSTNYETTKTKVCNLAQFVAAMRVIWDDWGLWTATIHPWFRGQSSESWGLLPGLYRGKHDPVREREMLRDFKTKALNYLPHMPPTDLECMFIMQHHGMPTRLLDWTENYLCALFFAVAHATSSSDAVVWVLNPWALNETALGYSGVPTADAAELIPYQRNDNIVATVPAAIRPNYNSKRLAAQRGVFTLHGEKSDGLEELIVWTPGQRARLHKVVIEGSSKMLIQKELFVGGMSSSNLFPDLDGLCSDLSLRYSNEYLETSPSAEASAYASNLATVRETPQQDSKHTGSIFPPSKKKTGLIVLLPKLIPKKESERLNLPPKPTAAASEKLPTLPPGGPSTDKQKPSLLIVPPQKIMDEQGVSMIPPPSPPYETVKRPPDEPYDDYFLTPPADYFVFQNWKKYGKPNSQPLDEGKSQSSGESNVP